MNEELDESPEADELASSLKTLFRHYELWLAERTPEPGRDTVFWEGERIEYDQLQHLKPQRKHFVAPSPYPGLRSFTPHEGRLFFGRRTDVDQVRDRLKAHRMVMVLGGSGSGKSSLIRAGVLPYLNSVGGIGGRGGTWYWCEFRPERAPIDNLLDALTRHVVFPLLKVIGARLGNEPELEEGLKTLGLSRDASFEEARSWLAAPFAVSREQLFDALWDFVQGRLDVLDELASGGFQADNPNILILLDQFEEVFREGANPEQKRQVTDLLCLLAEMDKRLRQAPWSQGGLFVVLTMRSEELHRCGEHDGLTNLVNRSIFLLELLDAERQADREVLRRAIVEPARRLFTSYKLPFDQSDENSPFAPDVTDWLIDGAAEQWRSLEHRPDQLPLLQHALRAIWHGAVSRWKSGVPDSGRLLIEKEDLPGDIEATDYPDFDNCLSVQADEAAKEARGRFWHYDSDEEPPRLTRQECPEGEVALRAAISTLARQDDRGNPARRFATPDEIVHYLEHHSATRDLGSLRERVEQALVPLVFHGYLAGGNGRPYDVSHEALLRNWERCKSWLKDNEDVVDALKHLLDDLDPEEVKQLRERDSTDQDALAELVPETVLAQMAKIGESQVVSEIWARDQLEFLLDAAVERRRRWIAEEAVHRKVTRDEASTVLAELQRIVADARGARDWRHQEQARLDEQARLVPILKQSEHQAKEAAKEARDAEGKARRRLGVAAASGVFLLLALVGAAALARQMYISNDTARRGLAISEVDGPHASEWSQGTKLGVLEAAMPRRYGLILGNRKTEAELVASRWDSSARDLLGSNFWLIPRQRVADAAQCWTKVGPTWRHDSHNIAPDFPGFKSGRLSASVGSDAADLADLALFLKPRGKSAPTQKLRLTEQTLLPPLGAEAQICLSRDLSIMTVAGAQYLVPAVYELAVSNCTPGNLSCGLSFREIRASLRQPAGSESWRKPDRESLHNDATLAVKLPPFGTGKVTSIDTNWPVRIAFDVAGRDAPAPAPGQVAGPAAGAPQRRYVAAYYMGLAAARRTDPPPEAQTKACGGREANWDCSGVPESIVSRVSLIRPAQAQRQLRTPPSTLVVRLKASAGGPLRTATVLVPHDIKSVFVVGSALLLQDGIGDFWSVNIEQTTLRRLVGTNGDSDNLPPSVVQVLGRTGGLSWLW